MCNTEGVLNETGTAYHSLAIEVIPGVSVGSMLLIFLIFCVMFFAVFLLFLVLNVGCVYDCSIPDCPCGSL